MKNKKINKASVVMLVFGVIFIISGVSLAVEGDLASAVTGVIIGVALLVIGKKRLHAPTKEEKARQAEAEQAAERKVSLQNYIDEKTAGFEAEVAAIPLHNISMSNYALERREVNDMPQIAFSTVSKTFNPSSLPAFVVIDTETTGLKSSTDRIIELSAVIFESYKPVAAWSTLINPGIHVPSAASDVNGIYDEDLIGKPTLDAVAESFLEFVGRLPVVGYNIGFDLKFLFCSGIDLISKGRKKYDVLSLARKRYKNEIAGGFSLGNVCAYHDIFFEAHRSLSDCCATGELFRIVVGDITGVDVE